MPCIIVVFIITIIIIIVNCGCPDPFNLRSKDLALVIHTNRGYGKRRETAYNFPWQAVINTFSST